ncbi:DUF202 domain-containing protein [Kineosporia rhizophila]|uniref:YidH family protein n=1 Tax=Kineosporia TaxID=49184 RepID=UPI001E653E31|nr:MULTISPECIES: DUF202 domain-containing protein [Kineosporia]MCE0538466.1 DUF202 domain-containing protein [Kineosporia rhizophila]
MVPSWERRLLSEGKAPDPRFTLANERTFLAWIRTSLGLIAGGIGADAFLTDVPDLERELISSLLLLMGGALGVAAYRRWWASERAMRAGEPLPLLGLAGLLGYGVGIAALVLVGVVLLTG